MNGQGRTRRGLFLKILLLVAVSDTVYAFERVETSSSACSVQEPPPITPLERVSCPENEGATLEEAKDMAWRFAPVVKFHPLERYHLQDISAWYNASVFVGVDGSEDPNVKQGYRTLRTGAAMSDEARDAFISGAPFDSNGHSTADIYYTVSDYDGGRFWLYNFDLFFSWNGCSNQELVFDSTAQKYIMCPAGEHEGDLERLSVLVCKSDSRITRIGYNQHGWSEVRDCDAGKCPMDPSTGNPLVYSALESHSLYPENNGFHTYYAFGPLYVGDRTGDDAQKMFVPRADNVVYLPPLAEIETTNGWDWAKFSGNWGSLLSPYPTMLYCFSEDGGSLFGNVCEDTSASQLIKSVSSSIGLANPANEQFMHGPLFRPSNFQIKGTEVAPILESGITMLTCADDAAAAAAARSNQVNESAQIPLPADAVIEGSPREQMTEDNETNEIVVAAPPPRPSSRFVPSPLVWPLVLLYLLLNYF